MSNIRDSLHGLPKEYKKIIVHTLTNDFDAATRIETHSFSALLARLKPKEVIVQNVYVGINASDINFTAGRYDPTLKPPFDCGFEAVGTVVVAGKDTKINIGQAVAVMQYGCFSEYQIVAERALIPIPAARDVFLPLIVSGLTSHLALKHHGLIKPGERVLVTAAAGGAGQIACQLAKLAGCHVIGTCSTGKEDFLKSIGVDRVINYKKESVKQVLKSEYPSGIDVVFESVGGEMFKTCFNALAVKGRLIVIGSVANYAQEVKKGEAVNKFNNWESVSTNTLLAKSITVTGFFLNHYYKEFPEAMQFLTKSVSLGANLLTKAN
jgi:NADPH:quinone reductase-like Zn-dependent oxidoreductase